MNARQEDKMNHIERLEELMHEVPSFESFVVQMSSHFATYRTDGGFSDGEYICHDTDCSIMKFFAAGEVIFPVHAHVEYEYIIVLEGTGFIELDGVRQSFAAYSCVIVKPNVEHTWYFETDTKLLAITIPASKGFPHGQD